MQTIYFLLFTIGGGGALYAHLFPKILLPEESAGTIDKSEHIDSPKSDYPSNFVSKNKKGFVLFVNKILLMSIFIFF